MFVFAFSTVGPVHAVHCSPFHRNLFLSCGADGSIALFSLLQAKPLLTLNPSPTYILSVSWSLVRPLVFAATAEDGTTYIYDLGQSTTKHVAEVHSGAVQGDTSATGALGDGRMEGQDGGIRGDRDARGQRSATTSVAFNPRQRALFATANASGSVHLWRLPETLSTALPKEEGYLERLARSLEDGDAVRKSAAAKAKASKAKAVKKAKKKAGRPAPGADTPEQKGVAGGASMKK